jgi:acyl-CoA thioesterase-1
MAGGRSAANAETPVKIVALGDSLTAGLGLPEKDGFVPRLQAALAAKGMPSRSRMPASPAIPRGWAGPPRLVGAGRHRRRDRRTWRQRHAARDQAAGDARRAGDDPATPDRAPHRRSSVRHARGAESRVPITVRPSSASIPSLRPNTARCSIRSSSTASPPISASMQHDGLHPAAAGVDVIVARILPKVEELIARSARSIHREGCMLRAIPACCGAAIRRSCRMGRRCHAPFVHRS